MKKISLPHCVIVCCAFVLGAADLLAAGGPLIPPGPPAVIYKTLDEIEPRIPISSLPFSITAPGSYYLTGVLTGVANQNGITISANDVTVDLNGFTLVGLATSLDGIRVSGARTNIAIHNGVVRNWGNDGIDCSSAHNSQLRDLRTSNNTFEGMQVGTGGLVVNCTSQANGEDGIDAGNGCTLIGCSTSANKLSGITVDDACSVSDCSASANTQHGIAMLSSCRVVNNTCDGNGVAAGTGAGIQVSGTENRIEGNNLTGNDIGLDVNASSNVVVNNSVRGNTDNYDFVANNQVTLLLSQIPESIDWPCSVILAGSLTGTANQNGIAITANDVTIDLAGHSLIGVTNSRDGILVSGNRTNIAVRNGTVRSWGSDGVQASSAYNSQFESVRASNNGANGLQGGNGGLVKDCQARANGADGIVSSIGCTIVDCASSENGSDGIVASTATTVSNCTAYNNDADGIAASSGSTVTACTCSANTGDGIQASFGSTITGCTLRGNSIGINAASDCRIVSNCCDGNATAGIQATSSDNRIDGNVLTDNGIGIDCNPATGNFIVRNSASGNTTNYDIAAGNDYAQILAPGNAFAATNPWANFSF